MTSSPQLVVKPYTPPPPPRKALGDAKIVGVKAQPVSDVHWIHRSQLQANDYNPNRHASPELILLAISILEDGWTQPIVARPDHTIVDGFHRWTVSGWPGIEAMTEGLVPVVFLVSEDEAQQRMATIRHNRARGSHYVLSMADLLAELVGEMGVEPDEAGRRLGMEPEEVRRLLDRGDMLRRGAAAEFNKGWAPTAKEPEESE